MIIPCQLCKWVLSYAKTLGHAWKLAVGKRECWMLKMCHKLSKPLDYWLYSFISFIIYPFLPFFFSSFGSVPVALSFSRVKRQQRDSNKKCWETGVPASDQVNFEIFLVKGVMLLKSLSKFAFFNPFKKKLQASDKLHKLCRVSKYNGSAIYFFKLTGNFDLWGVVVTSLNRYIF